MRAWIATSIAAVVTACTTAAPNGGLLLVDHAGVAGRWRRLCELGMVSATAGSCGPGDGGAAETAESDESDDADHAAPSEDTGDAGASDGCAFDGPVFDGSAARDGSGGRVN